MGNQFCFRVLSLGQDDKAEREAQALRETLARERAELATVQATLRKRQEAGSLFSHVNDLCLCALLEF